MSKVERHLHYRNIKGILGNGSKGAHDFTHTYPPNVKSTHTCQGRIQTFQSFPKFNKGHDHCPEANHSEQCCVSLPKA